MKTLDNYIVEKLKLDKTLFAKNKTDIDDIFTIDDLLNFMNADNIEFEKGNRKQGNGDIYAFDNDNLIKFTNNDNFDATIVGKIAHKYSYKEDNIAIYQSQHANTFSVTSHLVSQSGRLNKINILSLYITKDGKCIIENHYNYADHTRLTEDLYIKCLQIFAEMYQAIDEYVSKL